MILYEITIDKLKNKLYYNKIKNNVIIYLPVPTVFIILKSSKEVFFFSDSIKLILFIFY